MLDRATLKRPIAHRGLHDAARGIIENTAPAFDAAIAGGFGIECDVRPAGNGLPIVFHDDTLDRLVDGAGSVHDLTASALKRLRYRGQNLGQNLGLQTFAELLDQVGGRVPLFVEIKSEWDPPEIPFLAQIARHALDYQGPIAVMSFDPDVMVIMRELAHEIPRGIVSGSYTDGAGETWWPGKISAERGQRLANLDESQPVGPSFYAYHVGSLPHPAIQHARDAQRLPILTWTVRTAHDREIAKAYADAAIFEGAAP